MRSVPFQNLVGGHFLYRYMYDMYVPTGVRAVGAPRRCNTPYAYKSTPAAHPKYSHTFMCLHGY